MSVVAGFENFGKRSKEPQKGKETESKQGTSSMQASILASYPGSKHVHVYSLQHTHYVILIGSVNCNFMLTTL